jgi:hypothetical protein
VPPARVWPVRQLHLPAHYSAPAHLFHPAGAPTCIAHSSASADIHQTVAPGRRFVRRFPACVGRLAVCCTPTACVATQRFLFLPLSRPLVSPAPVFLHSPSARFRISVQHLAPFTLLLWPSGCLLYLPCRGALPFHSLSTPPARALVCSAGPSALSSLAPPCRAQINSESFACLL